MAYKAYVLGQIAETGLLYSFSIFTFKFRGEQKAVQSWVLSIFSMINLTYPGNHFIVSRAKAKVEPEDWDNSFLPNQFREGR